MIDEAELSNSKLMPCAWLGRVLMLLLKELRNRIGDDQDVTKNRIEDGITRQPDRRTDRLDSDQECRCRRRKGEDDGTNRKERNGSNCIRY